LSRDDPEALDDPEAIIEIAPDSRTVLMILEENTTNNAGTYIQLDGCQPETATWHPKAQM
jgi:hypothetical protein